MRKAVFVSFCLSLFAVVGAASAYVAGVTPVTLTEAVRFLPQLSQLSQLGEGRMPVKAATARANAQDLPHELRLLSTSAAPGSEVTVPVEFQATGTEQQVRFSLQFNPQALQQPQVRLAEELTNAHISLDQSLLSEGKLGVTVTLPGAATLVAGQHTLLHLQFHLAGDLGATNLALEFGDTPVVRGVLDAQAQPVSFGFVNGLIATVPGLESDTAPRPANGNGELNLTDWAQIGRFAAGLETPETGSEFQRADCAPFANRGDGQLDLADWVQAGRYAAGLDAPAAAGGPSAPVTATGTIELLQVTEQQQQRVVRVVPTTLNRGQQGNVAIELNAVGDETAVGFTLNFDPTQLTFVRAVAGSDAPTANVIVNNNDASKGRVLFNLAQPLGQKFVAGVRQIGVFTFVVPANSTSNTTTASFTAAAVVDDKANVLPASFAAGIVTLTPTITQIPTLTSLNPATVLVGGNDFTLTVNGTNLVAGMVVRVNGSDRATEFVSATQLRATLVASDIEESGTVSITARTPEAITTNALTLNINNPVPTVTSINPNSVAVRSAALALTVTGTNFVPGAQVKFGNATRITTYVSSTQLTAQIPATAFTVAGTFDVSVINPVPGGGTSNTVQFTVSDPKPSPRANSISPTSAQVGSAAFALTVNGSGFVQASLVRWNGLDRPTTYVSSTQLTAQISAEDLSAAGTASVTVYNAPPGGGTSSAQLFTIAQPPNPVPVLATLSPASINAGGAAFTLAITGTGFVANSVVRIGGQDRQTSFISATEVRTTINPADIVNGGTLTVRVFNPAPGGGQSNELTLIINFVAPTITSVSPNSIVAGGPAFTLSVFGANFAPGSLVRWNNENRVTTVVSVGELTAQITAADIANVGTAKITVFSPQGAAQGSVSNEFTFTINQASRPIPRLTAITPTSVQAGGEAFTLTLTGTNFVADSVVRWNGQARPTTFANSTQLTAQISAADIANVSTAQIAVSTPAPGGGESNNIAFNVTQPPNPTPVITTINPTTIATGTNGATLTVNGTGFNQASQVRFNGQARQTTYVSATQLTAQLTAADLADAGAMPITVFNPAPGGGGSNSISLSISNPVPTLTSLNPNVIAEGSQAQTLTITGTNFVRGAQVLVNGATRLTTYVSATQVTIQLNGNELATSGNLNIQVSNPAPGGGASNALPLEIRKRNPVPRINTINPNQVTAGVNGFTLIVNGTGFVQGSVVRWNGIDRPTDFSSDTLLVAQISAADVAAGGNVQITVMNPAPGGGTSGSVVLQILNPAPRLTGISPDALVAGTGGATLSVSGSNFTANSVVRINGIDVPTSFVSTTLLTAQVSAAITAAGALLPVTVFNPAPGGGVSSSLNLTVSNPVPNATQLQPDRASAGSPSFTLTVTGTQFVPGAVVRWNGSERPTTFIAPTQLAAIISATDLAQPGTAQVIVANPAPGGGTAVALPFTISNDPNPVPVLSSLDPAQVFVGGQGFTLRVTGSSFVAGSRVYWNGSERPTSYLNATTLAAQIAAADIATTGSVSITVVSPAPGGGTSNAVSFAILQLPAPVPAITAVAPNVILAKGNGANVLINGSGFVQGSVARWNGSDRSTTYVSATQLRVLLTPADTSVESTNIVTVFNQPTTGGGGGVSNEATVRIIATPTAQIQANPASPTTDDTVSLVLSGIWFNGCVPINPQVTTNGNEITINTANGGQVCTAALTPWVLNVALGKLAGPATYVVRLVHTSPEGVAELGRLNLSVSAGRPTLTSLAPESIGLGTVGAVLTVRGDGFGPGATVHVNGSPRLTTLVGVGQLTAVLTEADVATMRTLSVTVVNPPVNGTGGGTSNALPLQIANPQPVITSLDPSRVTAGVTAFTLTVNGSGFVPGAIVRWNGQNRLTSYGSVNVLTATITAEDVALPGMANVTVFNPAPGGGLSNAVQLSFDSPATCQSVCFQSARYFQSNPNRLPSGSVVVLGLNNNSPVSIQSNLADVRRALQGGFTASQQLNAEYLAAQLSVAAGGPFSGLAVLNGSLRCYGVAIPPLRLSNGFILANTVTIGQIFSQVRLAYVENREADMLTLSELLRLLNGDDPNGRCGGNVVSSPSDPDIFPALIERGIKN